MINNEQIRRSFTHLELGITHVSNQVDDRLKVQQMRIDELAITNDVIRYRRELDAEIQSLRDLLETEIETH